MKGLKLARNGDLKELGSASHDDSAHSGLKSIDTEEINQIQEVACLIHSKQRLSLLLSRLQLFKRGEALSVSHFRFFPRTNLM